MDYCFIIFQAEFNSTDERDRAARYLAEDPRPEWGDDCLDDCSADEEAIFEVVDDCVFPLTLKTIGNTGLRWVCEGGEYDEIPLDWPERLQAESGMTISSISAEGEIEWQVSHFDGTTTTNAYVSCFFDDRERDQPIEDFERQFTTPQWQAAMFSGDEKALMKMSGAVAERWIEFVNGKDIPAIS